MDESGISERPTRVRTWAPKGQTPVIQFHFNWNHVSVIAGLTRTNCMFRLHEGSIKKEEAVEFLKALKAHLKQPLLVIWDGAKPHRSRLVRDYLDTLNGHIQIAFVLIMLGFLLQWPTLLILLMFPVLMVMYGRLSLAEERESAMRFGKDWQDYASQVPRFFPRLG